MTTTTKLPVLPVDIDELTQAKSWHVATASRTSAMPKPGDRIGSYVLLDVMAHGGCATVYAAEHQILGRRVAVKVLRRELAHDREMVERFFREARAVNQISHPNIIDIHDVGTLPNGGPYFVMERLDGENVEQAVRRVRRFTPTEVLPVLRAVGDALEAAHAQGIIHRDLKGSNIFLATARKPRTGDTEQVVKLLDFGVAKLFGGPADINLTTTNRQLGTPSYMAPEQFRGDAIDRRTDVYALGATLFYMLTGRPPFVAATVLDVERMHLEVVAPRASEIAPVGAAIDAVLVKALAKRPLDRFQTVAELVTAFEAALAAERVCATAPADRCIALLAAAKCADDELAALDFIDALADATRERGFRIAVHAGSSSLGIRSCDETALPALLCELVATARALEREYAVEATIVIAGGLATLTDTGASGPLLDYGRWAPPATVPGIFVAADIAALADLAAETIATFPVHDERERSKPR